MTRFARVALALAGSVAAGEAKSPTQQQLSRLLGGKLHPSIVTRGGSI